MKLGEELKAVRTDLAKLKSALLNLHALTTASHRTHSTKAGFRPDQLRDDSGRWTDEGRGGRWTAETAPIAAHSTGAVSATFSDDASVPLATRIAQSLSADAADAAAIQAAEKISLEQAFTGIDTIDQTTQKLANILSRTMETADFIPNQTPQAYGVAVHMAFAGNVKAADLEGIGEYGVEQSFRLGDVARYGLDGAIRTDVTLWDEGGRVLAIYDVKTGGAILRPSRANELRRHTKSGPYTPVIELHFSRGASLKHESFRENSEARPAHFAGFGALPRRSRAGADRLHSARLLLEHDAAEAPHGFVESRDAAASPAR